MGLAIRRGVFRSLFAFMRLCDISCKSFVFRKREFASYDELVSRISREAGSFLLGNLGFLQSLNRIIVYCDYGQKEIASLVNTLFSACLDAEVWKVSLSDCSLLQAADMFCTLTLLEEKLESGGFSNFEREFFTSVRDLKKNCLKPASAKRPSQ